MEQEVATLLESLGFIARTNRAFEDPDEGKSRELDVWAVHRVFYNEAEKLSVFVEVLCECKNTSAPYVFLGRRKNYSDKRPEPKEYLFPIQEYEQTLTRSGDQPKSWRYVPAFQRLGLAEQHYYYRNDTKAVQFCKLARKGKTWEANHGGIYDAIFYPLVKALLARQEEVKPHSRDEWKSVVLFFPVVVVQGDIYYIDSEAHSPQPRKVQHVTFTRELKSRVASGTFAIDFVTLDGLKDFIETQVRPFVQYVSRLAENSPELLRKKEFE